MGNLFAKFFCSIAKVFTFTLFGFDTCMQKFDTDCDAGRRSARIQVGISDGTSADFNLASLACIDTRGVNFQTLASLDLAVTPPKLLTTAVGTCTESGTGVLCVPESNAPIALDVTMCCPSYNSALGYYLAGEKTVANALQPTLAITSSPVDDVYIGVAGNTDGTCAQVGNTEYGCVFDSAIGDFSNDGILEF
jgi:hypothetical protein